MNLDKDYGKCDRCEQPASFMSGDQRLCSAHRKKDVKQERLETYRKQKAQRELLQQAESGDGLSLVLFVSAGKNLDGDYWAAVTNPILSCENGFGQTPERALRQLGLKIADSADLILHRIKEHEFEIRQLETDTETD